MKALLYIMAVLSLTGCVSPPEPLAVNHPANPRAESSHNPRPVFELNTSAEPTSQVATAPSEHADHEHPKNHE
jgi:hypothetical protein